MRPFGGGRKRPMIREDFEPAHALCRATRRQPPIGSGATESRIHLQHHATPRETGRHELAAPRSCWHPGIRGLVLSWPGPAATVAPSACGGRLAGHEAASCHVAPAAAADAAPRRRIARESCHACHGRPAHRGPCPTRRGAGACSLHHNRESYARQRRVQVADIVMDLWTEGGPVVVVMVRPMNETSLESVA